MTAATCGISIVDFSRTSPCWGLEKLVILDMPCCSWGRLLPSMIFPAASLRGERKIAKLSFRLFRHPFLGALASRISGLANLFQGTFRAYSGLSLMQATIDRGNP